MGPGELLGAHHRIDLAGVPATLLIGEAMSARRARTYAALLECGVLPVLDAAAGETTGSLLRRAFAALAQRYDALPFGMTVMPFSVLRGELVEEYEPPKDLGAANPVCVVLQVADGCTHVDATAFERALAAHDRRVAAALLEHLRRTTRYTFDAFTPGAAFAYADWALFEGDPKEWWETQRHEAAADLGITAKKISGQQIRRYIRTNGIRTPGLIDRVIGRHHRLAATRVDLLPLEECERRLEAVPSEPRAAGLSVIAGLRAIAPAARALAAAITPSERGILGGFGASGTMPGLIVETSGSDALVTELLNDHWEYASQDRGFAPNYVLALDGSPASCERLARTLAHLTTVTQAVTTVAAVLDPDTEGEPDQ